MDVSVPSLVVDIGSLSTRVGYAGEDCPRQIHQSCVGIPESPSSSSSDQPSGASSSPSSCAYRFPLSFVEKRLHLSVEPCLYPVFPSSPSASSSSLPSYYFHEDAFECILRGSVEGGGPSSSSSSLSTRLLQHSSSSSRLLCPKKKKKGAADLDTHGAFLPLELCGLGESFTDTPILFSEPNLHCVSVREKIAEIVFETFDIPALYMVPRALLSCFSVGRTTGMVIDIGAASTSITPVVDGFSLHRECGEWPVGGNFLDRLLGCVFSRHRLPLLPLFSTYKRSRVLSFLQNTSSSSSSSAFSSSSSQHALRSLDHEKHRGRSQPHHHHHQPTSAFSSSSSSPTTKGGGGGGGQSTRGKGASMSSSLLANEALKRRHHLDWTGVNEVYLHYSQNAALRYMRESFCRVFPGLHHPNQHLLPAGTSSGSVSSSSASSNGGGLDDLHNKKGEGGGCPTPGYRTISPLVLPPPPLETPGSSCSSFSAKSVHDFVPSKWLSMIQPPSSFSSSTRQGGGGPAPSSSSLNGSASANMSSPPGHLPQHTLELPDGTLLQSQELADTLPEVFFSPGFVLEPLKREESWLDEYSSFRGLIESIRMVGEKLDVEIRKEVFNGLVLTGGCSAMPGLCERLTRELGREPGNTLGLKWRLLTSPGSFERRYGAWIGGSILASMNAFHSMWCSREEYDEHGPSIVDKKCY